MDRQEIFRYIEVGSSKSISVDRRVLKDYPVIKEANLKDSWENLKVDFVKRKLSFPERYSDYQIRDIYWRALYEGDIRVDDPWEVFEKLLFKMMDADMDG